MFSYFKPNFIEKNPLRFFYFNFLSKLDRTKIKIDYLAGILKGYDFLIFFFLFAEL